MKVYVNKRLISEEKKDETNDSETHDGDYLHPSLSSVTLQPVGFTERRAHFECNVDFRLISEMNQAKAIFCVMLLYVSESKSIKKIQKRFVTAIKVIHATGCVFFVVTTCINGLLSVYRSRQTPWFYFC